MRIAEQRRGDRASHRRSAPGRRRPRPRSRVFRRSDGQREIGVAGEVAGHDLGRVDDEAVWRRCARRRAPSWCRRRRGRSRARDRPCRPRRGWRGCPPASCAMRTWLKTAPPFWARPAMSIMPQPLPSRCAAMPRIAPTVTTPVPPTPVTMIDVSLLGRAAAGRGSGRPSRRRSRHAVAITGFAFRTLRPARSRRTGRSR